VLANINTNNGCLINMCVHDYLWGNTYWNSSASVFV